MRMDAAELHYSPQHVAVPPGWATAFMMVGPDIEAPGFATLVPGEIRLAATELRASVSEVNSLIQVKGPRDALLWKELSGALQRVRDRAANLQSALSGWV
jgi:hypothetical protein